MTMLTKVMDSVKIDYSLEKIMAYQPIWLHKRFSSIWQINGDCWQIINRKGKATYERAIPKSLERLIKTNLPFKDVHGTNLKKENQLLTKMKKC